jgi:hypothetical protein
MSEVAQVYTAIASVMLDISQEGIAKGRANTQQGYKFRGIDDVYNALAPILARHRLVITPRCLSRECVEAQSKSGGRMAYVTVDMEFQLTCAEDGSIVTARMFGEAMDTADKATNKAMSAAYKYMAMQQFCIPTEGDNDADAHTPEVISAEKKAEAHLRSCAVEASTLTDAWNSNWRKWGDMMDEAALGRLRDLVKTLRAEIAKRDKSKPDARAAEENPFGGDGDV